MVYRLTREEYEDRYGERPVYCHVHHRHDIDGCEECAEEEEDDDEE